MNLYNPTFKYNKKIRLHFSIIINVSSTSELLALMTVFLFKIIVDYL